MTDTARLKLPLMAAGQSQKHVTFNEAITQLDLLAGIINVTSQSLTAPAGGEGDGTVYVLGGSGTGAWSGFSANDLALRIDGGWRRVLPQAGMLISDAANGGALYRYASGTWSRLYPVTGPSSSVSGNFAAFDDTSGGKIKDSGITASDVLTQYAVNLYQDSGRFAGNAVSGIVVSTFAFPAYLTLYNSTTSANQGKFIHDNNDYGGSSGSLDSEVKALVDQIRDSSHRQFGNEFYVAKLTMGSGTSAPTSHSGSTYYRMVFTAQKIRAPAMTFHVYLKALDDNILVRLSSGQTATLNGVAKTSSFLISPGDGWVSLTVRDVQDPAGSFGYSPEFMVLSAKASGHRVLLACPALMGGIVDVDDNVGIIAGYNSWSAS